MIYYKTDSSEEEESESVSDDEFGKIQLELKDTTLISPPHIPESHLDEWVPYGGFERRRSSKNTPWKWDSTSWDWSSIRKRIMNIDEVYD